MPKTSPPSPAHKPKRRLAPDVAREKILLAAEAVFSEHGYHKASLTDIATRADFAVGTLYLYFKDKADLYGNVILEKMKAIVSLMEKTLGESGSPAANLRKGVHAQFGFHDANRRFFEIFLHQHQTQGSPLHPSQWEELEGLKRRNLNSISACIVRGQEAGEIRAGNPKLFAVAFLGIILQMLRQWFRENKAGERISDSADFAADCFLFGAATPPSK